MSSGNYWERRRVSRRRMLQGSAAAGMGLAATALIGCGGDDDPDDPMEPGPTQAPDGTSAPTQTMEPAAGDPRQGGTLNLHVGSVQDNHNPVINFGEANFLSGVQVYDRLISPRPDERVYILEAAESVELPDDTTVVFQLKEGMVFQDIDPVNGRAVVADDIVQTQLYARDEELAENRAFQQFSMDSVEAPDDRTVVFTLQAPNAYLFSGTQLGLAANNCIIPSELIHGDLNGSVPIGSGPYLQTSAQFGVRYEYERSPTYRGAAEGLPYVDRRVRTSLTDASALDAAFRSEQTTEWTPPPEIADRLVDDLDDRLTVEEFTTMSLFTRNMSRARETFDDIRVREAFYRWFDPDPFIEIVAGGWGVPAPGQLAAGLQLYQLEASETEEFKRYDVEEAVRLLDAAGFDYDATYELTTISTNPTNNTAVEVYENQLRAVGIRNITYITLPTSEWLPNITNTGNYDFCVVQHPAYDTPQTPLRLNHTESGNINAWMGIRDPEIDAMIEASEQLIDLDENIEAVKNVQLELLQRYAHLSYVYTAVNRNLRYAYINDWEFNPATHPMYRVEAWLET
jgi:peptide/nickel transport system substrate-binding protein